MLIPTFIRLPEKENKKQNRPAQHISSPIEERDLSN